MQLIARDLPAATITPGHEQTGSIAVTIVLVIFDDLLRYH